MIRLTELRLPLEHPEPALRAAIVARLGIADAALRAITVFKRSYDARKSAAIVFVYTVDCEVDDERRGARPPRRRSARAPGARHALPLRRPCAGRLRRRRPRRRPVVVGFGPCGLFAALILAQMGLRPIVLERGKAVRERTKDTWGLWRRGVLDPNRTCSSAKAAPAPSPTASSGARSATRAISRARCSTEFVKAGAPEEILYVAKPHIGTFRLVGVVEKMRAEIEAPRRRDPLRRSASSTCGSRPAGCAA